MTTDKAKAKTRERMTTFFLSFYLLKKPRLKLERGGLLKKQRLRLEKEMLLKKPMPRQERGMPLMKPWPRQERGWPEQGSRQGQKH